MRDLLLNSTLTNISVTGEFFRGSKEHWVYTDMPGAGRQLANLE
jgi:hypothetical protein